MTTSTDKKKSQNNILNTADVILQEGGPANEEQQRIVEIAKSIRNSREKYYQRKRAVRQRKQGLSFMRKNKIPFVTIRFGSCDLTIAVQEIAEENPVEGFRVYKVAAALCSEKDEYSVKTAQELLGERLLDDGSESDSWRNGFLHTRTSSTLKEVFMLVFMQMMTDILQNTMEFPEKFVRIVREEIDQNGFDLFSCMIRFVCFHTELY